MYGIIAHVLKTWLDMMRNWMNELMKWMNVTVEVVNRILVNISVADLHSKILDARPPWGSKFFQFHAVFGKIWQNRMLAPPLGSWRPLLGEILDPPLHTHQSYDSQFIDDSSFDVASFRCCCAEIIKRLKDNRQQISVHFFNEVYMSLLAFVVICLLVISKWPLLPHGMLWI